MVQILMCVDTVFEAIFNCDAMPGDLWTIFSKQFSIAMPCKVICLCFEGLHLEWCRFSCVLTFCVLTFFEHIHAMPGDLFVFRTIAS